LYPAVVSAKDETDSLNLFEPVLFHYKKYKVGSSLTGFSGLTNHNAATATNKKVWFKALRISGYARFYPYCRIMQSYYNMAPDKDHGLTLPVNVTADDGYQQPLMLLRLEANPSAKTYFQSELQFDNLLKRTTLLTDTAGRLANLYVIFKLEGSVDTRFGKIRLIAGGGANWYRLSPSSLWGYQYRDDMFERYPWEPEGHDFARYNSYYSAGDIPRDQRFGMVATQGFTLEVTNMPAGFDAALLFGKTNSSGAFYGQGVQSSVTKNPQNMIATRIGKKIADHKIGFNYFDQFGYTTNKVVYKPIAQGTDTFYVEDNRIGQTVATVDGRFDLGRLSIFTEMGAGSFLSSAYNAGLRDNAKPGVGNITRYKRNWDETLFLEITTKRSLTFLPLKVAFYRIGANVVNNSSSIVNTSVEQAKSDVNASDQYYTNYFDGMVTEIGQLANNRQGINFTTSKDFFYNKLKTKLALGMAQEIVNLAGDIRNGARAYAVAGAGADSNTKVPFTNSITFEHKLNSFTRSRFAFYQRFQGPYGRHHSIFRRSFENIAITDSIINYKKSFSTIDLELKYKLKFLGKELILSNYINCSSVQDKFSPIPVLSDKAFLRYFYEEYMMFYSIHPKITLVGFIGFERGLGNKRVEVSDANGNLITDSKGRPVADPNGKTINQVGHGYGLGLDYNFHQRASLNFRNRLFDFKDKNFTKDKFKGDEMTVELKVFF
jgi:hypothetical protein